MLDEVRGALPFSTSHWRADTLSSGATATCARCIRPHPTIMHVAMLIMIRRDWHQNSAVPEIADDESRQTDYALTARSAASRSPRDHAAAIAAASSTKPCSAIMRL